MVFFSRMYRNLFWYDLFVIKIMMIVLTLLQWIVHECCFWITMNCPWILLLNMKHFWQHQRLNDFCRKSAYISLNWNWNDQQDFFEVVYIKFCFALFMLNLQFKCMLCPGVLKKNQWRYMIFFQFKKQIILILTNTRNNFK